VGANVAPKVSSFHWGSSASAPADSPAGGEGFLNDWEKSLNDPDGTMQKVQAYKKKTGQKTEMVRAAAIIPSCAISGFTGVGSTANTCHRTFWSSRAETFAASGFERVHS